MTLNVYEELQMIWSTISTNQPIKDASFDISLQEKLLDIFQAGDYYYFIVNVRKSIIEVMSPEVENVLGYPSGELTLPFVMNIMHPEDLPYYLNFESAITKFLNSLSGEKLFKYKIQHDFRLKKADGNYLRILNQFIIIQHEKDNVRTFVINTDISHLKKDNIPVLSFIGMNGEPSYSNVNVKNIFKLSKPVLTRREKDVLRALARGMNSAEISDALCISKYTVDSHRKNMLKKTEAKSTTEILGIAFNNGWM
ncbi:LuxR C-terminal-related transcriptional regulator [Flavobacterium sp. NRK1]|uniref:LuxR C-terminal-related transcriptional regulator n=1 Tax=Flavobacterium sp. NRK1 TaxID=2954929 RepID=UPI002092644C|nr:LuxR C-terminal-related transcriptional regulator [Flavobacterium sp. NRK1]MCO6148862.1 LuxR C-terminal-related transcriptional regulator [Flavobacterium sp. NRK1]